jgi:hypothetical protein
MHSLLCRRRSGVFPRLLFLCQLTSGLRRKIAVVESDSPGQGGDDLAATASQLRQSLLMDSTNLSAKWA